MAKALLGHLAGPDTQVARLAAENAALRSRVGELTAHVAELQDALDAANAVADGRLVDLVEASDRAELDVALREVSQTAPA